MAAGIDDLPFDPAALCRRSPWRINNHHQNNHGGAVKWLHVIRAQRAPAAFTSAPGVQRNGLKPGNSAP